LHIGHRYLRKLDCSRYISLQKIHFNNPKQGRLADPVGRQTRQAGRQGKLADKAGWQTRQAGKQGRQADKAGRQARQARSIDGPDLASNIFAVATNRNNIQKKTGNT
jgi:hypothetical protein